MHDDRPMVPAVTDAAIMSMFATRARRADGGDLRGAILTATAAMPQVRTGALHLPQLIPSRLARVLTLALLAAALGALALIGSGAFRRDLAPKETAIWFVRPFEYSIPATSALRPAPDGPHSYINAWVQGPDVAPVPSSTPLYGGQDPESGILRGIIVASGELAWSHSEAGRFYLRTAPAEFIADLRDVAGVSMGPVEQTTLDGRPALTTVLPGLGGTDIHVLTPITGLVGGGYVYVNMPGRLVVSEIDDTTVFILTWARTSDDLARWLPVADEFVASIHFLPEDTP